MLPHECGGADAALKTSLAAAVSFDPLWFIWQFVDAFDVETAANCGNMVCSWPTPFPSSTQFACVFCVSSLIMLFQTDRSSMPLFLFADFRDGLAEWGAEGMAGTSLRESA